MTRAEFISQFEDEYADGGEYDALLSIVESYVADLEAKNTALLEALEIAIPYVEAATFLDTTARRIDFPYITNVIAAAKEPK